MTNSFRLKKGLTLLLFVMSVVCLTFLSPTIARAAEETPPRVETVTTTDVCPNVPGDQATEPCADTQCVADGGAWNGSSCDMPPPPAPTCTDTQHLEGDICVDNVQTAVATSTDGTGGLTGGDIVTGDAVASTTVSNELNTNTTNDVDHPGETNSSTITGENMNEGELGSMSTTTTSTGENQADGGTGLSTIVTGNALSTANVINVVNTNIFNSEGIILFLNQLFGGGLDLRTFNLSYFFDGEAGASPTVAEETEEPQCTLLTCMNSSTLNVLNTNVATVTNSVIVRAATGANTASSTDGGGALISTGDAYAAANVLNLVNTNIINSSYLLVSFNNFGNLAGDITLPDSDFFTKLLAHGGSVPELNSSTYDINNTNLVDFTGTTTADALTGDNMASTTGTGHGDVVTGNAYSSANTFTDANSNYFGGTSVFFLFRTYGNWTGTVKGLPAGMSWATTTDGVVVMSDNTGPALPEAPDANCDDDEGPVSNCFNSSHFMASSTNTALVEDNIDVSAVTGQNETLTENGTSTISTGNAYAVANVLNMINTNIVGRNWMFAIFNIFGDWDGDISFGQSELQLEALADTSGPVLPGTDVMYHFTIANNGDADAEDVVLNASFDKDLLAFEQDGEASALDTETGASWDLGKVARGETRTFNYRARVGSIPAGTSMTVPLTATVNSNGGNEGDVLFTLVTIDVVSPAPAPTPASNGGGGGSGGGGGGGGAPMGMAGGSSSGMTTDPSVTITKTANVGTSTAPAMVDYKVVVRNHKDAGPAYTGILTDTLYKPSGEVMYQRSWDLETIAAGDEITLTYTVEYGTSTVPGIYRNVARVTAMRGNPTPGVGYPMTPIEASREIVFNPNGVVLGVATSTPMIATSTLTTISASSCMPLLSTFMRRSGKNSMDEVKKLQEFLNSHLNLSMPTTGYFGPITEKAVRSFQITHKDVVLTPLGLTRATGAVFGMTQRAINELSCGGVPLALSAVAPVAPTPAPLSSAQVKPKVQKKVTPIVAIKDTKPKEVVVPVQPVETPVPQKGVQQWFKKLFSF